jgi:hypothetical protein
MSSASTLEILEPWETLDEPFASHWEKTLRESLPAGHPLQGVKARTLAYRRLAGLYRLEDHPSEFAMVDFLAPGEPLTLPHSPPFILYRDAAELMEKLILPMHEPCRHETHSLLQKRGHFTVFLTPRSVRHHYDERASLPAHDSVLRPILRIAEEALVYGLNPTSEVGQAAAQCVQSERGRHRLLLDRELIVGHELFWNATGGQRGTIAIRCKAEALLRAGVFSSCYRPNIMLNVGAAHTPSAIRLARQFVADGESEVICLPRNNGLAWADVFAPPTLALELYERAFADRIRE